MDRGTGIALGATVAFASGLALAACSPGETGEAYSAPAAEAQTTQASLPVVTVYKSPT
jgi:hypothetical protein